MAERAPKRSSTALKSTKKTAPNSQKIQQLRAERKAAIADLNFARVKELDQEIDKLANTTDDNSLLVEMKDKLTELYRVSMEKVSQLESQAQAKRHDHRTHINEMFKEMKQAHINEIIEMDRQFAQLRLRESERSIPERDELIAKARTAANLKEYEKAASFQEHAIIVGETELEARFAKVDQNYNSARTDLLSKQKKAIASLSKKLQAGLKQIETELEISKKNEMSALNSKLGAMYLKYVNKLTAPVRKGGYGLPVKSVQKAAMDTLTSIDCPIPSEISNPNSQTSKSPRK